jgi:DNA-binding response OmpR family regulator
MGTHSNYTILIVDDEEAILKSLKRVFRKEQYEVVPARRRLGAASPGR